MSVARKYIYILYHYFLNKFKNKQHFFLEMNENYRVFLSILYNLGIKIPVKKTKTEPLIIEDFNNFKIKLENLERINLINLHFKYLMNNSDCEEINEIKDFIQKLYNEEFIESYFTDIELDIILNENKIPESFSLEDLMKKNYINDNFQDNSIDYDFYESNDEYNISSPITYIRRKEPPNIKENRKKYIKKLKKKI